MEEVKRAKEKPVVVRGEGKKVFENILRTLSIFWSKLKLFTC